jgi:phosphate-selective porin OprO/OprP
MIGIEGLGRRGGLLAGAAGAAAIAFGAGVASAQEPQASAPANAQTLQAEVEELKALIKAQAERDQRQIDALSAQVKSLQAEVQQQTAVATAPPSSNQGLPRTAQNGATQSNVPAASAAASGESRTGEPRVATNQTHRLRLETSDGQYSIGLAGLIQFDAGAYNFHADNAAVGPPAFTNGVNARRARIGVVGTAPGGWGYALVYDTGNSQDTTPKGIQTAQVVYGGIDGAAIEIGYSNTFFTLDQSTSSADLLFLERSSASNIATNFNTGDSRSNAGFRLFGDRYWAGAYLTGPASGDSHTLTAERFGAFERVAVQALRGKDYSLHLGFGVSQLIQAPNSGNGTPNTLSLSDQPELRIDPTTLLNTGTIGNAAHPVSGGRVYDLETAATYKGLFWQGEYYHYQVSRLGLPNNDFDGGYGQIGWVLTGETHTYNNQAGSYYRVYPTHPFSLQKGTWGAVEIAARYDYVGLNSDFTSGVALASQPDAVEGGIQRGVTAGLNWYPNDLVRFMLDYNHIDYDKANGTKVTGANLGVPVGASFDAVSLRAQVAY